MPVRLAPAASLATLLVLLSAAPALGQTVLPYADGFEGTGGETYTLTTPVLLGATAWGYENTAVGGRLRTAAGPAYARTGLRAATLDRSPAGPVQANRLTLTLDLSLYSVAADTVVLDFAFMDHGEEPHAGDRVWVRGTIASAWVELANLNQLASPLGLYEVVEDLNVSGALAAAGQDFSSTFQVRFGQEDDSPSTGVNNGDGLTFDDIELRLVGPDDAAATSLVGPTAGECGSSLSMIDVEVTNLGGNTVAGFPVEVTTTDALGVVTTVTGTVQGPLGFHDTEVVTVGPVDLFAGGLVDFAVTTLLPGDTNVANDTWLGTLDVGAGAVPLGPPDGACPGFSTTVSVQPEGATLYTWWDAAVGGSLIGSGPSYTTPPLAAATTYWVERVTSQSSLGAIDNTVGTGGEFPDYSDGLVFDVAVPAELDSVLVYPSGPGDLTLNLEDSTGLLLDSITVPVVAGPNVVSVGFALPVGTGFRLHSLGSTVPELYRNTGGALFPYPSAGNEVTITGNINGLASYYYYYYDWQITAGGCDGERTEVFVDVGVAECDTDLVVAVTGPPELVPGTQVAYNLSVVNDGPDPLTAGELTLQPPASLVWVGATGGCTSFPCALGALDPGAGANTVVTYDVPADLPASPGLEYAATALPTGGETDPDPANSVGAATLPVVPRADLRLDVVEESDPLYVGGSGSFLVHMENAGPSQATGVSVASLLPVEFASPRTLLDACEEGEAGVPWCSLGALGPGEWADVMFEVDIPLATTPRVVTSQWTASSDAVEAAPGDEVWAELTEIGVGADLELTLTLDDERAVAGDTLGITLGVLNHGPDAVAQPRVQLTLPPGVEATLVPSGCDASLLCSLDGLTLGQSDEVGFTLRIDPAARGTIRLGAVTHSERIDPDERNDRASEELPLAVVADLAVEASVGPGAIEAGDRVAVTVLATNRGPSDVTDAEVVFDMPPAGLSVDGCAEDELGDTVCPVGGLHAGEESTLTVTMVAADDALGTFTIPVTLRSSAERLRDPDDSTSDLVIAVGPPVPDPGPGAGCSDCESSVAGGGRPSSALLFGLLLALGVRRRR